MVDQLGDRHTLPGVLAQAAGDEIFDDGGGRLAAGEVDLFFNDLRCFCLRTDFKGDSTIGQFVS